MRKNDQTPWGPAQHVRDIAEGILIVSTAGHGGVRLSADRVAEMKSILGFVPGNFLNSVEWWEEDCDQAIPAIVFHEHYDARNVYHALNTVKRFADGDEGWNKVIAWAEANEAVMAKVNEYKQIVDNNWLPGSRSTIKGGGWNVIMHKGGESKIVRFDDYPTKDHYSDEEVAAMMALVPAV